MRLDEIDVLTFASQRNFVHIDDVSVFSNEAEITLNCAESSAQDLRSEPFSSILISFEGPTLQHSTPKLLSCTCG